ncbi:MAG: hypothetical protein WBD40_25425 [Tepidisphaeraceae bacterium]
MGRASFDDDGAEQPDVTLTVSGSGTVNEEATYTVGLSLAGDTAAVGSIVINWGDGEETVHDATATQATHVYADGPASYSIVAWAMDDAAFLALSEATHTVAVSAVVPTDRRV